MTVKLICLGLPVVITLSLCQVAKAQCEPRWLDQFPSGDLDNEARAAVVFDDDGPGPHQPALYVGGSFSYAGGQLVRNIARWDGEYWSSLGSGMNGAVYALMVFDDDGNGPQLPALYAGGIFTNAGGLSASEIAKWDGTSWSPVGTGLSSNWVNALAVYDSDGAGPQPAALYAGGAFQFAGSLQVNHIAKWNGTTWSALGSGTATPSSSSDVNSLHVFDEDGAGPGLPALIVGGSFTMAGGISANRVAKWNGANWSALGSGVSYVGPSSTPYVYALSEFDEDGDGPALSSLFVAGSFNTAGGVPANHVAKWAAGTWSSVGGDFQTTSIIAVYTLFSFDSDGIEPGVSKLMIGGTFSSSGSIITRGLISWDGTAWSSVGGDLYSYPRAMCLYDDDGEPSTPSVLMLVGRVFSIGVVPLDNIGKWDGVSWSRLGPPGGGANGAFTMQTLEALEDFDSTRAGQMALFASGGFLGAGGVPARYIAKWDGISWAPLGTGLSSNAYAMASFDEDSEGPMPRSLYVVGPFAEAGGVIAPGIARWDGTQWFAVGGGLGGASPFGLAAAVFDEDGNGPIQPALFVGGDFTTAGGATVNRIARWDGESWTPVGSGTGMNFWVRSLVTWDDDDSGPHLPALYAGGVFNTVDGIPATGVARWDGSSWTSVSGGLGGGSFPLVDELAVFDDDGPGPNTTALYAGGLFTSAGGVSATNVAKWNGTSWSSLASGLNARVWGLSVFDPDGDGPSVANLYAGGEFFGAGLNAIARWDGLTWTAIGNGVSGGSPNVVEPMAGFDLDGPGGNAPALFVGGSFKYAGNATAERIARWGSPVPYCRKQPPDAVILPGVNFKIAADVGGAAPITFEWQKDDQSLSDGGRISGATTATLAIAAAKFGDSGLYELIMTNVCGATTSRTAVISVACPEPIDGDFNHDGATDGLDMQGFASAVTITSEQTADVCKGDFDLDGFVSNSDIDPFVTSLLD